MSSAARHTLLPIAAAACAGILLAWSGLGAQADLWAYDWYVRLAPPAPASPSSAVILSIDEQTLAEIGGVLQLRKPLAEGLERIARYQPAAVAIDLVLSEPRSPPEDAALEQALKKLENTVLAANLRAHSAPGGGSWEMPLARFRDHAAALGHVHADPDVDGVCRRLLLAKAAGRERLWALALEAYRLAQGAAGIQETREGLEIGGRRIPAPAAGQRALRILFPNPRSPIERIPLHRVLNNPAAAAPVRGRVVFVGVQVLGGLDRYLMTPFSYGEAMTGVEINAGAYETLARGAFLTSASPSIELVITLLAAAALALCFLRLEGKPALAAAAAVLVASHAVPFAFLANGRVFSFSTPVFTSWLCFLAGASRHYLVVRGLWRHAESETQRYRRAVHYVTHEMRTPLTTIQGSSELISRYSLPEEKRREIANLIHSESQRLARMVDTFLGVERLTKAQLELQPGPVSPRELISACVERGRPLAARKQIDLQIDCQTSLPIWGDREFLDYACYNLVSNAIKYSPAQTSVTVRARQHGDRISISVEDRGYGMDAAELRNIFKRFYRTQRAEKSGEPGSGLGLALVEEIVVQHGGSVEVESRLNQGSRFTLHLPAASPRASDVPREPAQA